jgi:putative tryptophan/tyrosine transport system substrate-binding protein
MPRCKKLQNSKTGMPSSDTNTDSQSVPVVPGRPHVPDSRLRRRDFTTLVGGALVWSLGASAQQPATPVIGFLSSGSPGPFRQFLDAFHQGLNEEGFVEGRNVAIEYRWAEGQFARLPELVADLVARRVSLIAATGGTVSASAAKGATSTIPILFIGGPDPVADGLVTSLNRPGGNATGVAVRTLELMPKRVELLRELLPHAAAIALLVNPTDLANERETKDVEALMRPIGGHMVLLKASAENDFEPAFVSAVRQQADALLVSPNPFFMAQRAQIVTLAARHAMPAAYAYREYVNAGGLMSYGPSIAGAYRQIGLYAGRILKGEKPSDLPVHTPTKFELILNLKVAQALRLTIPRIILARADEVIE